MKSYRGKTFGGVGSTPLRSGRVNDLPHIKAGTMFIQIDLIDQTILNCPDVLFNVIN